MLTLKNYFRVSVFVITVVLFTIFYFFASYLHTSILQEEHRKTSSALSEQVFSSMYQVMRKGWSREELETFLASIENSFAGTGHHVAIYRGEKVEALYGKIEQTPFSEDIKNVFESGKRLERMDDTTMSTITPIVARGECLQCHTNASAGDILGTVEVSYAYGAMLENVWYKHFIFSLLLFPVILMVIYFITKNLLDKIDGSINSFRSQIRNINSVKDFKQFDVTAVKGSFQEFDTIINELDELTLKLKDIAVDKDILEFEVKLLDKLIITSEIVQDWKEYIKELLLEINTIMPVYSLITIFQTEDEYCEIEVFWIGKPSNECKLHMEMMAKKMVENHRHMDLMEYSVNHNVCNEDHCLISLQTSDIDHESKSLILDTPKIGGIVGLGLQSQLSKDTIFAIVIDSILTTLLNLVGSIKAIHKYTENLEYYATRDPLTGLFNQRVFRDLMEYEIKRARRHKYHFGLLVIDCDNFKMINDKYGHSFGDTFLQSLADTLEAAKRDEDILARYGGDEFTIILPQSTQAESYVVAQRILEHVHTFTLQAPDGEAIGLTVSIGLATYPDHAHESSELFDVADTMMYRAKSEGKDNTRFPDEHDLEEIHQESENKAQLVLDALRNRRIVPHFQPIMRLNDQQIEICELLMRIDVDNTLITATNFIETAEALGVIHQMDYIVIEAAFAKIKESGYNGLLFINLSPKSLIINEFIGKINTLVHTYGIDKGKIVFEITERETVKSFSLLERFVLNLKLEGYRFAIDDFGSGFSSFHYIKKFPIDYIKIDGDFILNINSDRKDLAFVKSIVSLAKELEVETIAEFVENETILEFLKDIEIDYAQGYYIGKPSPNLTGREKPTVNAVDLVEVV
jgi:diguanylate cyclase (GGDEF)-like protein